jgi:hypothetical protein
MSSLRGGRKRGLGRHPAGTDADPRWANRLIAIVVRLLYQARGLMMTLLLASCLSLVDAAKNGDTATD